MVRRAQWKVSVFFLAGLLAAPVAADTQEHLAKALDPWAPDDIRLENDFLTIVTHERRVTENIFSSIISYGVCMPVFTGANNSYLSEIKEIYVINTSGIQGYVFSGGREDCEEIGGMPSGDTRNYVLSRSRTYVE